MKIYDISSHKFSHTASLKCFMWLELKPVARQKTGRFVECINLQRILLRVLFDNFDIFNYKKVSKPFYKETLKSKMFQQLKMGELRSFTKDSLKHLCLASNNILTHQS